MNYGYAYMARSNARHEVAPTIRVPLVQLHELDEFSAPRELLELWWHLGVCSLTLPIVYRHLDKRRGLRRAVFSTLVAGAVYHVIANQVEFKAMMRWMLNR